ncbi:NAD(P)-dependent dehydrogenase, short-chain alcohol dehydrogenase family [Parasphingorhabdus marina DSM 22363]|uniref:NAD(P)-dependent dehydrogenase, short-chain alcohol dehydrogenase family n=1 Tax=Parasphingorhabdus marina DSM 22363 TaxID=1123272 RepID=A0A1N6CXB7_9SPHN|nr:SDR family oxidoreductase [Parasphingorhabdus marina]SIN63155.1 NAD(P)-dependent dehydrogenase, short-chain alcohol dehydrogenase family [Parasphingorhabdus marina DSM 22363]
MTADLAKLALVTGGCRRLGARIAERLAASGYQLALHGHSDSQPDDQLMAALEKTGVRWQGFVADFAAEGAAGQLVEDVADHFGHAPTLVVNNASLFEYDDLGSVNQPTMEHHFRINTVVPTLITSRLSGLLKSGDRAAVVHILDQRVRNPNGDQLSYTISKQALAEAVRTLARACAPQLRVNGVAPGLTLPTQDYAPAQMTRLAEAMPLGRLSDPEDIAEAVRFLAEAPAITGQTVFVDGGAHLESYDRDFVFLGKD